MDIEKYYSDIKTEIEKLKTEQAVRTEKIKRLAEELGLEVNADLPNKVKELQSKTQAEIEQLESEIEKCVTELESK